MTHLTTRGWFHLAFAAFGIVAGAIQLLRRKGDRLHRALGYAYVYGMIISNATALTMYRFTGSFNVFHAGAIVNFACIIAAMLPVLRAPRTPDWMMKHYRWVSASYIGLQRQPRRNFLCGCYHSMAAERSGSQRAWPRSLSV